MFQSILKSIGAGVTAIVISVAGFFNPTPQELPPPLPVEEISTFSEMQDIINELNIQIETLR